MTDPRRDRLDQPIQPGRVRLPRFNPEAFGRWSESIARYMGTAKFLVYMTVVISAWFAWNTLAPEQLRFDPYTFTFLTLILSLQASYAAPLILLAQNRQADRDRVALEEDRAQNQRLQSDVEYLTRELAAMRLALGDMATRDFLRDQLRDLTEEVVARTSEGVFDQQARLAREERERRAERKKRRPETTESQPTLSEPFVGDSDTG